MKISKSDQDPHQTDADKSELERLLSKKSQHFLPGTRQRYQGGSARSCTTAMSMVRWYSSTENRQESFMPMDSHTTEFTDQWGAHQHNLITGPPYEPKTPVQCEACITRLESVMNDWFNTLTQRHNLSDNFWTNYKFGWSK